MTSNSFVENSIGIICEYKDKSDPIKFFKLVKMNNIKRYYKLNKIFNDYDVYFFNIIKINT